MEDMIELEVELWQKVKYSAKIKVTPEQAELLMDENGLDISMYLGTKENPLYTLLEDLPCDTNEIERDPEFLDLNIEIIEE